MRTNRSIVALGVLITLLIGAEVGARILEPQLPAPQIWDTPFVQDKAIRIEELGDVDIAVIGSSIANASIDVTAIAQAIDWADTGYNASNPGSAIREWGAWDEDLVLPELCPEIVVISMGPRDTNDNEPTDERELSAYLDSEGRRRLYGEETVGESIESFFQENFSLVAIRERLREPRNLVRYLDGEPISSWTARLTPDGRFRGFDGGEYVDDLERDRRLREGELRDYQVGPIQFDSLQAIIEDIEATGAYVVIVDMPLMREQLARVLDDGASDLADYDRALGDLARETGVAVLSYPDMNDRGTFYADLYHMALPGTQEISSRIGRDLAELFPERPGVDCASRPSYEATTG
jgi:hypothetical protein